MGKRISSITVSLLLLASVAQAQTTSVRGGTKGSSTPEVVTSTSVDANHTALDVNIAAGGGAGGTSSTFGSAFPATGTASGFKDSGGTLMQPGNLDASGRLFVNCGAGCAGGSATPTDAFANPTTAGLSMTFNMGWNGTTWDRFQLDASKFLKVNCATGCSGGASTPTDAFANPTTASLGMGFNMGWNGTTWDRFQLDASKFLKVAVQGTVPVSGTFWQTTQPVSGTFWQTTQPVSGTVTVTDGAGALNVIVDSLPTVTVTDGAGALNVIVDSGTTTVTQGTATNLNAAVVGTGTAGTPAGNILTVQGVASMTKLLVTPDSVALPANQSVNVAQMGGVATSMNTGVRDTGTQRVTVATNDLVPVNQTQMNGVAVSAGSGIADTGTQRLSLAQELTYSAGTTIKTATAAGTGVFFALCGSATKTISVQRLNISGTVATAAVWGDVIVRRTSAATSGGTATTLTGAPMDSTSAAATATAKYYTVLATAGTLAHVVESVTNLFPVTAISATLQPTPYPLLFRWKDQDSTGPVLRGTAQCMEAAFGTTTTNAPTLSVAVTWTER